MRPKEKRRRRNNRLRRKNAERIRELYAGKRLGTGGYYGTALRVPGVPRVGTEDWVFYTDWCAEWLRTCTQIINRG